MQKSMKKTKILYFVDTLEYGGIQTFILNVINNIKNVEIDILTLNDGNDYPLENILRENNIKVYKLNVWIKDLFSYLKYKKKIDNFFKNHHDYKILHLHGTSKNYYVLKKAKEYNISTRIIHSHSTNFWSNNIIKRIIGNTLKNKLLKYSTDFFACSYDAGKWLFNDEFNVIPNGIEIEKYKYNKKYKTELIEKYKLENKFIIGTVSRLTYQKNILVLIDVLKEIKEEKDNAFLIIIGSGELENKLIHKIKKYNLENDVLILKNIDDVYKYYNLFDCFVLPSKYEGFSRSILEAQVNGLQCIVNKNALPKEVFISNNIIEVENNGYKDKILNAKRNDKNIDYSKYDIKEVTKYLEDYYHRYNNMEDLISIIVPVYNVEIYLDRCINSIINQTYENIEIIIVNDGSTDNSYDICKTYDDKRIRLYSTKNKGLSAARNYGISKSKGKYLAFVDSDDYIEKDMIEVLYNNLKKEEADLSCCSLYETFNDKIISKSKEDNYYVMNSYETIKKTFTDEGLNVYVWNKLYKKELFKDIKFPVNKNSEDIYVMYKIIKKCKKVVYQSIPKYYYVQRKNSIVNNTNKINLDSIEASLYAIDCLKDNKELQKYAIKNYLNTRLRCYKKLVYGNKDDKKIREDYLRELSKYKDIPYTKKERVELLLLKYTPGIYKKITKNYYNKKYNKMY